MLFLHVGKHGEGELDSVVGLHLLDTDPVFLEEVEGIAQEAHGIVRADLIVDAGELQP